MDMCGSLSGLSFFKSKTFEPADMGIVTLRYEHVFLLHVALANTLRGGYGSFIVSESRVLSISLLCRDERTAPAPAIVSPYQPILRGTGDKNVTRILRRRKLGNLAWRLYPRLQ